MSRKWPLAFWLIYFGVLMVAAVLVGSQNQYFRLTLPASDALLLAGIVVGTAVGTSGVIVNLVRQQRWLLTAKYKIEEAAAAQAAILEAQEKTIVDQAATICAQESITHEQQEFRRALNHELRNPITAIKVGVESLRAECHAESFTRLQSDVERVSRLLDKVSALTRLEVNPITFIPVNLAKSIRQVVEMIQATPESHGCTLTADLPTEPFPLPRVPGDEDLLFIMLHNLINNAVKFSPANAEVVIRAFEDDGSVVIQISDNGLGMSTADVQQAGQPFRRGQIALDHKIPGSGLGLYQACKIIALHHGKISIHSERGKGTVLTLRLPVHAAVREGLPQDD